jgi:hypothetical protein
MQPSVNSSLLGPNIILSILSSIIFNLCETKFHTNAKQQAKLKNRALPSCVFRRWEDEMFWTKRWEELAPTNGEQIQQAAQTCVFNIHITALPSVHYSIQQPKSYRRTMYAFYIVRKREAFWRTLHWFPHNSVPRTRIYRKLSRPVPLSSFFIQK